MMVHDYSIEALAATFSDHAEMAEAHNKQINEAFKQQNPDQELPEHMTNPFNVARALSVIAGEVEKLKNRFS